MISRYTLGLFAASVLLGAVLGGAFLPSPQGFGPAASVAPQGTHVPTRPRTVLEWRAFFRLTGDPR